MKVVVTGAAGFIGSHVAEFLLKRGDKVLGIDEINDYYSTAQKEKNCELLTALGMAFVRKSILDPSIADDIAAFKPDAIINLAARAGVRPSILQPKLYYEANTLGTLALLDIAKEQRIKQFIQGSTSSIYGDRDSLLKEDDKVDAPISPYAASKKAAEELCFTYHHLYSINVTCLRFFTVYGPRGRPDMAPWLFTAAIAAGKPIRRFGDGTTKRDYTYVGDITAGVVSALDKNLSYEIINLGNGNPISLNDFIQIVEEITGKQAIIKQEGMQPGDVSFTQADISKAKELLGYSPQTSFRRGMEKFIAWYDELHQ